MNIKGESHQAKVTVTEHTNKKHRYYFQRMDSVVGSGFKAGGSSLKDTDPAPAPTTNKSISQKDKKVNESIIEERIDNIDLSEEIDSARSLTELITIVVRSFLKQSDSSVLKGNTTIIETARGMEVEVQYLVVPQKLLVASHNAQGIRNKEFPDNFQNTSRDRMKAKLQNRDRSSHVSQYQADQMSKNIRPRLLGANPFASDGAPVTNAKLKPGKYVVLSGNGRTISLGLACSTQNESNDKYFEWLEKEARNFGIDPEDIAGMKCPRLIRNVIKEMSSEDLTKFVKQANKPSIQAPSAQEVAVEDASEISTDMLKLISPTKDGRIEGTGNIGFISTFFQNVLENDPAEIGRMQNRDGQLTDEGVDRITRAVFMRAYGDPTLIDKLVRRGDDESKKLTKGLLMAAPEMAKLGDDLARIDRLDLDISSDIIKAVLELEAIRSQKGRTVEDALAYVTFDDQDVRNDPAIVELLKALEKTGIGHRGKADNVKDFILEYIKQANNAVQESQMGGGFASVFGEAEYKKDKMLEAARKAVVQESIDDTSTEDIEALIRIITRNKDARKILSRLVNNDQPAVIEEGITTCFDIQVRDGVPEIKGNELGDPNDEKLISKTSKEYLRTFFKNKSYRNKHQNIMILVDKDGIGKTLSEAGGPKETRIAKFQSIIALPWLIKYAKFVGYAPVKEEKKSKKNKFAWYIYFDARIKIAGKNYDVSIVGHIRQRESKGAEGEKRSKNRYYFHRIDRKTNQKEAGFVQADNIRDIPDDTSTVVLPAYEKTISQKPQKVNQDMSKPLTIEESVTPSDLISKIDAAATIQDIIGIVKVWISVNKPVDKKKAQAVNLLLQRAEYTQENLSKLDNHRLKALLQANGLPTSGNKQSLIDRLIKSKDLQRRIESKTDEDWQKMSGAELKEFAKSAGLPTSGNKSDLIAKLKALPEKWHYSGYQAIKSALESMFAQGKIDPANGIPEPIKSYIETHYSQYSQQDPVDLRTKEQKEEDERIRSEESKDHIEKIKAQINSPEALEREKQFENRVKVEYAYPGEETNRTWDWKRLERTKKNLDELPGLIAEEEQKQQELRGKISNIQNNYQITFEQKQGKIERIQKSIDAIQRGNDHWRKRIAIAKEHLPIIEGMLRGEEVKVIDDTPTRPTKEEAEEKNKEITEQVTRELTEHPVLKGLAISSELLKNKTASILGQKVKSNKELAGITQIFRDPRYETLRYIFLKGKEIVGHTSVSCRLPGVAKAFPVDRSEQDEWFHNQLSKHGADGFYLLHNHPSGRSNPSFQDITLSLRFEQKYPRQYKGHVVIDSHEYTVISKDGNTETHTIEQDNEDLLKPSIEHPLLGERIHSPDDVLEIGKKLKKDGWFTLISHSIAGVRGIMEVPLKMVTDLNSDGGTVNDKALKKMLAVIRQFAVTSGAQDIFATGVPELTSKYDTFYYSAVQKGLLRDIIDVNGKSAMQEFDVTKEDGYFLGRDIGVMRSITREETANEIAEQVSPDEPIIEEEIKVRKETLNDVISKLDPAKTISDIIEIVNVWFKIERAPKSKIEDFGEKIGGAAKDRWKENNLTAADLFDLNDREALEFVKKDNIWTKIDYKALIDSGKDPVTAFLIKGIRDAIPVSVEIPKSKESQARDYFNKYIELVERIRDNAELANKPEDLIGFDDRIFADQGDGTQFSLSRDDTFIGCLDYKKRRKLYWALRITKYNIEAARRKVNETGWPEAKPWIKGYRIVADSVGVGANGVFVAKGNYIIRDGFENKEDAENWLKLQYDEKIKKRKKAGPKAVRPQLESIERIGVDHRQGKNVNGEDMLSTFKFRGGEFGNWLTEQDRQQSLNHAYDALIDLSQTMGIPAEALSLGGRLSFAFGARGKSKAAAHYEPARRVINLTKINGAGSLAHEFAHAFDHMLGDLSGVNGLANPYASQNRDAGNMRSELADALRQLKDSIFFRDVTTEEYIKIQIQKMIIPNREMEYLFNDYSFAPKDAESNREFQRDVIEVLLKLPEANEPIDYNEWVIPHKRAWESLLYDFVDAETGKRASSEFQKPFVKALNEKLELLSKISSTRIHNHPTRVPSQFVDDATRLDNGKSGKYYSNSQELFARAFESAIQDKISSGGNKSDYLVHSTKQNSTYGGYKPYPEGKEREAINMALDNFLNLLKSGEDTTILESIISQYGAAGGSNNAKLIQEAITTKKNVKDEQTGRGVNKKTKKAPTIQDSYRFQGLNISVERQRGSTRSGTDADGNEWSTKMKYDYGYIRSTEAKDGDCVDCYVHKLGRKSQKVFVIRQKKLSVVREWKNGVCPDCGKIHSECNHAYDEDKVMLGFSTKEEAIKAFLEHHDTEYLLGPVSTYSLKEFKNTLEQSFGKRLPLKIEEAVESGIGQKLAAIDNAGTISDLKDAVSMFF
ncbi:hypothetical protein KKI24_28865 [bacterium]|nr:hypothetical protein [bacterium]